MCQTEHRLNIPDFRQNTHRILQGVNTRHRRSSRKGVTAHIAFEHTYLTLFNRVPYVLSRFRNAVVSIQKQHIELVACKGQVEIIDKVQDNNEKVHFERSPPL